MTRWGLTLPLPLTPLESQPEPVKRAEAAGYTDLWSGETNGPDGFTPIAFAAAQTERVRVGTGVVGVFTRGPALLAQQAAAMADASSGRFALGIGASSDRIVKGWNGIPFEKPYTKVAATVDYLKVALAGDRAPGGFKLEAAPAHPIPLVLAALRGRMLRLAVDKADGAFTNFLPLSGLPQVVEGIDGAPEGFELLCRFFVCRASASRSSWSHASCSPRTSRSPSTRPSTAGSATATRSIRWSLRGGRATARPPPRPRHGT